MFRRVFYTDIPSMIMMARPFERIGSTHSLGLRTTLRQYCYTLSSPALPTPKPGWHGLHAVSSGVLDGITGLVRTIPGETRVHA
jgi:hypothetical protein